MKTKPFAGMYRCSCGYQGARYFFDSDPKETKCGRCEGKAVLTRRIDVRGASKATKARKGRKVAA
jgi:hypothetical protein